MSGLSAYRTVERPDLCAKLAMLVLGFTLCFLVALQGFDSCDESLESSE